MTCAVAIALAIAFGAWLGWRSCNSRWIDAAKYADAVQVDGDFYLVQKIKKWGSDAK